MGAGSACRSQILVERVLNQGVRELETARCLGELADQCSRNGTFENVEHVVLGGPCRSGQQLEIEFTTDHGRDCEHSLGFLAQTDDSSADHFAHAVGQHRGLER